MIKKTLVLFSVSNTYLIYQIICCMAKSTYDSHHQLMLTDKHTNIHMNMYTDFELNKTSAFNIK